MTVAPRRRPRRPPVPRDVPDLAPLEAAALRAAHAAAGELLKRFGRPRALQTREKPGAGLVTLADVAAERAALRVLKRSHPAFGVLAEESAPAEDAVGNTPGLWVIDPLDGTTNYVHGFPMFCVSIAATWRGRPVVGVIHAPVIGETFVARRGGGAWRIDRAGERRRMRVSTTRSVRDSLLTTGFTYRKERWLRQEMRAFARLSAVARAIRRPGSAALDLAYTACGVFDGFWEARLSPWDVAAGCLLVEEAGGRVSTFDGAEFSPLRSGEICATNGRLHDDLLTRAFG